MSNTDRHISAETLAEYLARRSPATIPIKGTPRAFLSVDPPNEVLRLEVSWDGQAVPAIADYVHISSSVHFRGGENWSVLEVHGVRYFAEAYPLLRSVADLVQVDEVPFATAVQRSLATYHDLLAASAPMAPRDEIGLFGELLVLSHLMDSMGAVEALQAWRNSGAWEEHDLGLVDGDVEIKTTTSEQRRHWISSLTQLVPTAGRPLWLLSIQLTGAGASKALRLPDLVDQIAGRLPEVTQTDFQGRLSSAGYRPNQLRESYRLLRLRSSPMLFRVNDEFPKIDPLILERGGARLTNLAEVSYTVSLDGIAAEPTPPQVLRGLTEASQT